MTRKSSHQNSIAAIKRQRTKRLARLATRAYYLHRRGRDEQMYNIICEEFVSLGGVYIKFLQGVLLQSEIMRRWHNPDKLKIFENLDHEPMDVVAVLQKELSANKLKDLVGIQPQPFAAGSFGQVYYGQHRNGKAVIIKVLRPMVSELLKYDLRVLGMFSRRLVSKMSKNIDIDLDRAIKDFAQATLRETDYIAEAEFAQELHKAFLDHPTFIIPETFTDLCTPHIIVQEYIEGISVAQLIRLKEQGVDPKSYVAEMLNSDLDTQLITLGVESLNGVFNLRRIQGDPHPGNVRLLSNNRVGMIDFGIAAPTPANKSAFLGLITGWNELYNNDYDMVNLFEKFVRFFVNDLYRALQRLGTLRRPAENEPENNYTRELGHVAHETFKKMVGTDEIQSLVEDGSVLRIMNQMVNKNNRFGFVMKLDASEILRAAQTYISLVDAVGRRKTVLPKVFGDVATRVGQEHPELLNDNEDTMSVGHAIDVITRWLERVAVRDPALFRQLMQRIKMSKVVNKADPHTPVNI